MIDHNILRFDAKCLDVKGIEVFFGQHDKESRTSVRLSLFEDRKEKQFMFENHYGHTIPRRESIVKRQVCIFILYYVMIKWKMLQKSLRIL